MIGAAAYCNGVHFDAPRTIPPGGSARGAIARAAEPATRGQIRDQRGADGSGALGSSGHRSVPFHAALRRGPSAFGRDPLEVDRPDAAGRSGSRPHER